MTKPLFAVLCLMFAASSSARTNYPQDVLAFLERREICEHFRQEPWPEGTSVEGKERREFIAIQFKRFCVGSDNAIRELKKKYKHDSAVTERLEQYESDIEGK